MRTFFAARAIARSSERPAILEIFVPLSGSNSYIVTTGPGWISSTRPFTRYASRVSVSWSAFSRRVASSMWIACGGGGSSRLDGGSTNSPSICGSGIFTERGWGGVSVGATMVGPVFPLPLLGAFAGCLALAGFDLAGRGGGASSGSSSSTSSASAGSALIASSDSENTTASSSSSGSRPSSVSLMIRGCAASSASSRSCRSISRASRHASSAAWLQSRPRFRPWREASAALRALWITENGVRSTTVMSSTEMPITNEPARPRSERRTSPRTSPSTPPGMWPPKTSSPGRARCTIAQPTSTMTIVDATRPTPSGVWLRVNRRRVPRPSSSGTSHAAMPNAVASTPASPAPTGPIQLRPPCASYDHSESVTRMVAAAHRIPSTSWRRPISDGASAADVVWGAPK